MNSSKRQSRNAEVDLRGEKRSNAKVFDAAGFVAGLRQPCLTPLVARKSRYSSIDRRNTRHEGYALCQKDR
jgi:hypothetical protein